MENGLVAWKQDDGNLAWMLKEELGQGFDWYASVKHGTGERPEWVEPVVYVPGYEEHKKRVKWVSRLEEMRGED